MTVLASHQVPFYSVVRLRPRTRAHCLLVFVYNEGERIRSQLRKMTPLAALVDVVIVDGGSTDGALALDYLAQHDVAALLTIGRREGLSAQMRVGFAHALSDGYEGVVVIDGNDKDDPAAVPSFLAALNSGVDHVQGSRFIPGGHHENTPLPRLLGLRLLHAPAISMAAGIRYTDSTNGFRGYSRAFLLDPRVNPFRDVFSRYELHYYLAIRAPRLGFRVAEVPVSRRYPASGKTPTKISPLIGSLKILATLLKAVAGRYDPCH